MGDAKSGRLAGCRALITGASRGIGRAIAEAYAREGADLFLTATAAGNLAETEAAVAGHGGRIPCCAEFGADDTAFFYLIAKEFLVGGFYGPEIQDRDGNDQYGF